MVAIIDFSKAPKYKTYVACTVHDYNSSDNPGTMGVFTKLFHFQSL